MRRKALVTRLSVKVRVDEIVRLSEEKPDLHYNIIRLIAFDCARMYVARRKTVTDYLEKVLNEGLKLQTRHNLAGIFWMAYALFDCRNSLGDLQDFLNRGLLSSGDVVASAYWAFYWCTRELLKLEEMKALAERIFTEALKMDRNFAVLLRKLPFPSYLSSLIVAEIPGVVDAMLDNFVADPEEFSLAWIAPRSLSGFKWMLNEVALRSGNSGFVASNFLAESITQSGIAFPASKAVVLFYDTFGDGELLLDAVFKALSELSYKQRCRVVSEKWTLKIRQVLSGVRKALGLNGVVELFERCRDELYLETLELFVPHMLLAGKGVPHDCLCGMENLFFWERNLVRLKGGDVDLERFMF